MRADLCCGEWSGSVGTDPQLPPDIAIIDIKMPLMDGMEVAEYIYKNHIRTSVIFLTAYADFQYARKAIQYQVSDYIVKTAALEEIPAAIANIKQRLESENMTWYRMLLVTPVRQGEKVRKILSACLPFV